MNNSYNKVKGWCYDIDKDPMTITYNGVTRSLAEWAAILECAPITLRNKMLAISRGNLDWDEAMLGKAERSKLFVKRKNKTMAKKKVSPKNIDMFFRMKLV